MGVVDGSLTDGCLAPVTDSIVLIQEDPEVVVESVLASLHRDYPKARNWVREGRGGLREAVAAMERYGWFANRWVVMGTTRPGWTAVFGNGWGPDYRLLEAGRRRWEFTAFVLRGALEYQVTLERSQYPDDGYEGRNVRVLWADDSALFVEVQELGEPWPFEPEYGNRCRVRPEVMTAEVMRGFVRELGFAWVWDEEQYAPDGRFWLAGTSFKPRRRDRRDGSWNAPFEQSRERWRAEFAGNLAARRALP